MNEKVIGSLKKVVRTDEEWQSLLTDKEYRICRKRETEKPFSGTLLHNQESGEYLCACCRTPLFHSARKYDSGCGWPSFDAPINEAIIRYLEDFSNGMHRIEIRCAVCDSHLGHVFPDGPKTTGERYCVNSVSLTFNKTDKER